MRLSEALAAAKTALDDDCHPYTECMDVEMPCHDRMHRALSDLIDAVEETLLAQKKEADLILDLADLRRWGGSE